MSDRPASEIRVEPYDGAWPDWFAQLQAFVWPAVCDVALRIDHVGSTAVPSLAAKPIIDMDIVVGSEAQVDAVRDRLATIGYEWLGNLGILGREAFEPPTAPALPDHHLYLVVENNKAHLDHVLLRDLLIADGVARRRYANLKLHNATLSKGDLTVYTARKAALVAELLARARADRGLPPAEYWEPTAEELGAGQ